MNHFKKTIIFSAIGHLAVFGIFGFSFGSRLSPVEYAEPDFWGQLLTKGQVSCIVPGPLRKQPAPEVIAVLKNLRISLPLGGAGYFKPDVRLPISPQKRQYLDEPVQKPEALNKIEPSVTLHPVIPYGFTLYFKDRQVAHVELEFKIDADQNRKLILLKRKISSGNLEVDLLCMRYIWHYLFIRQAKFTPGFWQTVKIDLSAKEN